MIFLNYLKKVYYSGSNFICPFCRTTYRKFAKIGYDSFIQRSLKVIGAGRRNALCPVCGSSDRERLLYVYFNQYHNFPETTGYSILHIAPETNLSKIFLEKSNIEYICGDKFEKPHSYPSYVKNIDITDIPYPDNQFDLVICNHVLEHVPDDKKGLSEIYRVLKRNGKAILQVPISKQLKETLEDTSIVDKQERILRFGQFDHFRLYGLDYFERIKDVGFDFSEFKVDHDRYKQFGLNPEELIFLALKL